MQSLKVQVYGTGGLCTTGVKSDLVFTDCAGLLACCACTAARSQQTRQRPGVRTTWVALPHHMHGFRQLSQDVRCAPSLEQAIDRTGKKRMHEVWELGAITGEEDLVRAGTAINTRSVVTMTAI